MKRNKMKKKRVEIGDVNYYKGKWDVRLGKNSYFECRTQYQAVVLSQIVLLKKEMIGRLRR